MRSIVCGWVLMIIVLTGGGLTVVNTYADWDSIQNVDGLINVDNVQF